MVPGLACLLLASYAAASSVLAPTCERYMDSGVRPAAAQKSCCQLTITSCAVKIANAQKAYDRKLESAERTCMSSVTPGSCASQWKPSVEEALDALTDVRTRCNYSQTFWCKGLGPKGDGVLPK